MTYLEKSDIEALVNYRYIDESSQEDQQVIDTIENQNIELVKSYIASRYDVQVIFDEQTPVKHPILSRILSKLVIFDVIRRNAARKVPDDFREEYERAMSLLKEISTGRHILKGLPAPLPQNMPVSQTIWGNNKNDDFYI